MNIKKTNYTKFGNTGLTNLGNTCFLNSCIQILNHIYELHEILNKPIVQNCLKIAKTHSKKRNDYEILWEWKEFTELFWSGNGIITPTKLVSAVHHVADTKDIEIFTGWAQNDVTEFLRFLINCFHEAMTRTVSVNIIGNAKSQHDLMALQCYQLMKTIYTKDYSDIYNLFYGINVTEIKSRSDNTIQSIKPEHYFIIDLPLPDALPSKRNITIYDCMDLFVKPELLTGENQWFNEKTGRKEDVLKRNLFWNFPPILVITLKRFAMCQNKIIRRNELVECPLQNMDLGQYINGYNPNKYVYDLFGVCNHIGGPSGGHYTAYVKNTKTNTWLHCNDESVEIMGKTSLESIISPLTYCLFYRIRS